MRVIEITPFIERISIDEAFIDVTGLDEPIRKIAETLQQQVNTDCRLPVSIGGGSNKLIAKIANDWGKSQKMGPEPPNTITIIPPGQESEFLAPLPLQSLWGVGPKTAEKLEAVGITTIGALAKTPETTLEMLFGRFGPDLRQRALGIDDRPIELKHETKSVSNEITFAKDLALEQQLLQTLRSLSEQVGRRLRKESLAGSTIHIKLRWADFTTITRQMTVNSVTNLDNEIYESAKALFKENWPKGKPVRLIGVGVSNLGQPAHQLGLWDDDFQKEAKLIDAVDELREKFGKDIIKRGNQVHRQRMNDEQK
jgi:nucleotidyltransferase/DNA polymerase involved in DNA repair